jgi:GNAT superfamily N-acetyltransferase
VLLRGGRRGSYRRAVPTVDTELAGRIAAQGFWADPVQAWLFPPGPDRMALMSWVFASVARRHLARGGRVDLLDDSAVAMWLPPDPPDEPDGEGPPPEIRRLFDAAFMDRATRLFSAMDEAHPKEPHWYLAIIATVPEKQGQGLGARLISQVHEICRRDGVPSYLESSNARNLPFYFRHGYTQVGEILVADGPTLYPMWRD